jgi:rhamnogalacturonyl hydrolase YesR/pectate lyase
MISVLSLLTFVFLAAWGDDTNGTTVPSHQHYSEWIVESEMQRVAHPYNLDFCSKPKWQYSIAVEIEPMMDVYLRYGNEQVLNYIKEYPDYMVSSDGSIGGGYSYKAFNLDNVRPAHFLLRYHQQWPEEKNALALETLFQQLENQPRTQEGVWWHKEIYANQVWLDGIFMGLPYYTMAAPLLRPGQEKQYYDDAVDQICKTDQRTYDAGTRLWKHAWDETHSMFWANSETGQSQHTWGRALGWYSMAIIEVLDALPQDYERRDEVIVLFQKVMRSVVDYQDAESGVWYDVMDVVDSRNYLEATCSSMFAYCLLKGTRLGYLDKSYLKAGLKAYRGIVKQFVKVNDDGTLSLSKCCSVSGLGPDSNPRRDGSFEYYMSESIRDNDAKGVGPFVWASLEMEQMGYTTANLDEDLAGPLPPDLLEPFGWGASSDSAGKPYTLDGGWRNGDPKTAVVYASGNDDYQTIMDAIARYDIIVLDGSQGDFIISHPMRLENLQNKSIVGRNGARLCTQWHMTPELKAALEAANLNQYSTSSGTGGTLSNGRTVGEERELHTRQTIIDFTGDATEAYRNSGFFVLQSTCENIILRNLVMVGPGCVDVGGADIVSVNGANHVWIDHCDFIDGLDGNLDSGHHPAEMYVTYSWNKFHYTDRSFSHPYSNGTGWNQGYLQYITYAYNIWGEGCQRRLPQADWVSIHMLNNYYTCLGNSVAIAINANSRALVEGNYAIDGINNPFKPGGQSDLFWLTRGNIGFGKYNDATNTDQSLEVPYLYTYFEAAEVPDRLTGTKGAGATLANDDILLSADVTEIGLKSPEPDPDQPKGRTVYAVKEGDTFPSGTTVTLPHISLTYGEDGGPDFLAAIGVAFPEPYTDLFTSYTPGNNVNGNKAGGTFYLFRPAKEGTLYVGVVQNRVKPLYVEENGTALSAFNGKTLAETDPNIYTLDFPVKAGSTYKVYCSGSKLGFAGFLFEWATVKGDANGDGVVDVADIVAIVNFILENPAADFNEQAADVNGDGIIDVGDVVAVVNLILNQVL